MDIILEKNIIATITYYDVLDYPLTAFEVWKYLIRYNSEQEVKIWKLSDVLVAIESKNVRRYVGQKNGMYFLHGREKLVTLRRKREFISLVKMRKLLRAVSWMRISPFVRAVCVTGRLSYYNCDENSDLDVLVIYEHGHIWTGRFFVTLLLQILGLRRYGSKTKDRVCLNYHITTKSLSVPTMDLFAAHEYSIITPIFDVGYFENFCRENKWIKNLKPHHKVPNVSCMGDNIFTKYIRLFLELILGDKGMEKRLKKLQSKKIAKNPKTHHKNAIVLYNDKHLVFLPKPHGPEIFDTYKKRFNALELDF